MTQIATVEKLLDGVYAEIAVPRKSACGHDCEQCAGCGVTGASVHARVKNDLGAVPGQKVVVESSTRSMLGIVGLVYLVPIALFLLGYFLTGGLFSESGRYLTAGIGFAAGIGLAVLYDRKLRSRGGLAFSIVRLL
ncbi:MAG: SoxR reducing system RseC family protein [Oscillibacter sp.]|jgi:sigma-E factor negative regulatory protein RseC|nr:SoxR reducing system RseC family protein [Oscillibacter sp.]